VAVAVAAVVKALINHMVTIRIIVINTMAAAVDLVAQHVSIFL
jgi:hypothetical protein